MAQRVPRRARYTKAQLIYRNRREIYFARRCLAHVVGAVATIISRAATVQAINWAEKNTTVVTMSGVLSSWTADDDDLSALLEESEQLERETWGSTEASIERPISVLVRINANSRKSLGDRQLTKSDEIAGVKLLERLGFNTDSFELMRRELQRCNWKVTATVQSTNVAEWLAHKYSGIRDQTMRATRKRLNKRSQDSLTSYIHAEWNQKIKALEKVRQGDRFLDNINQRDRDAAAAAAAGGGGGGGSSIVPFGASPGRNGPAAAAAAAAVKSKSGSASELIHAMVTEVCWENGRPRAKGFLAKMRGPRIAGAGGHWHYVLSELFAVGATDNEHDMERRALFAARWFLEEVSLVA